MRPFLMHVLLLAFLAALGLGLHGFETFRSSPDGPLFRQYDATRIFWIGWMAYAMASSVIVLFVAVIWEFRHRSITRTTIVLSHLIPIATLLAGLKLGLHDRIQNILEKEPAPSKQTNPSVDHVPPTKPKAIPTPALKPFISNVHSDENNNEVRFTQHPFSYPHHLKIKKSTVIGS